MRDNKKINNDGYMKTKKSGRSMHKMVQYKKKVWHDN